MIHLKNTNYEKKLYHITFYEYFKLLNKLSINDYKFPRNIFFKSTLMYRIIVITNYIHILI